MNRNRNDFNYNEFNIKYDPTGSCNVKPQDDTADEENKNKKEELNKFLD